ncbi:selenocysteine-specific elongation factor selB homologue [Plasmodium gonderi]|uniref:Selenocysteine-specific elongation factor selB homologue n=1 Tax=Plasmodium gonderi TaxID=77519 RepID=A0A1Y1JBM5_PLAGO|nr:selenocysteine-specific elongation factor selB homologue [Plasmodium gonderi]GAW79078.1 selenocysteine-specific elongation factor selB homologue [Plasmodium gonderi]
MMNINVGVLGHVDSGKTSLCRCLSEVLSTCALDKHKQSQEKGITIDLGFSCFYLKRKGKTNTKREDEGFNNADLKCVGQRLCQRSGNQNYINTDEGENGSQVVAHQGFCLVSGSEQMGVPMLDLPTPDALTLDVPTPDDHTGDTIQVCLVDCPGHHSLLNCIIMGVEITDMIFLLIDINKGIQKQTIECLVLCEIVQRSVIIILNKIDLIPFEEREKKIKIMKKKIQNAFRTKSSLRNLKYYIIALSTRVKRLDYTSDRFTHNSNEIHPEDRVQNGETTKQKQSATESKRMGTTQMSTTRMGTERMGTEGTENISELINLLRDIIEIPQRGEGNLEDFYFLYDHTFDIKGKGTVYTGTVINGVIKNNCNVVILPLSEKGKIKEIQSFKQKVDRGTKGNRLSLLICKGSTKNVKKKVERGIIIFEKSSISHFSLFICRVKLVHFYGKSINNAELLTCIIGFSSSPCYGYFFKPMKGSNSDTFPTPQGIQSAGSLHRCTAESLHRCTTESLHRCTEASLHRCTEASLHRCTAESLHRCTEASLHRCTEASLHRCTETSLHRDAPTSTPPFDKNRNYVLIDQLSSKQGTMDTDGKVTNSGKAYNHNCRTEGGDDSEHEKKEEGEDDVYFFVVMKKKIHCYRNEMCIFLKNDDSLNCRICLHGIIVEIIDDGYPQQNVPFNVNKKPTLSEYSDFNHFKILREKEKVGIIERVQQDNHTIVCRNVFNSPSQVIPYLNQKVYITDASYMENKKDIHIRHVGTITTPFAKSGKFLAYFDDDISTVQKNYKSFLVVIKYYKDVFSKRNVFL